MVKFNHLQIPEHWERYWSKYPQGYTIMEALINWVSQVDSMVDNQNELSDKVTVFRNEIDQFISKFDTHLQTEVSTTLKDWQKSGYLDIVIGEALQTEFDIFKQETTAQFQQTVINTVIEKGRIKYAAHRGAEKFAPENSLPAFELASKLCYEWIELDLCDTLDDEIVINHDETVDRTTNGTGKVNSFTLDGIKALTIDAGANISKYPNLKIITLEDVLSLCKKEGLKPILEIKFMKQENFNKMLDLIVKYGMERECIILTGYMVYAEAIRVLNGVVAIMYLDLDVQPLMVDRLIVMGGVVGLGVKYDGITKEQVKQLHEKDLFVVTWTVDSYEENARQKELGVDIITTGLIGEVRR